MALVGGSGLRWSSLQLEEVSSSPQLSNVLTQANMDSDPSSFLVVGFAIVRSWRPLRRAGSPTRSSLRASLGREHRRCGPCFFLEHEIMDSCSLVESKAIPECTLSGLAACRLAGQLVEECQDGLAVRPGLCSQPLREIIARWRSMFALQGVAFLWPGSHRFSAGIARGLVSYDVTIVVRRNSKKIWCAPLQPSRLVRHSLLQSAQSALVHRAEASLDLRSVRPRVAHAVGGQAYSASELIASVRQAQKFKSQSDNRSTVRAVLDNPLSGLAAAGLDSSQFGTHQVGATLLRESRKRFDIAAMLSHREWYVQHGPCFRYLACDASPQAGQSFEVFVTVERVVRREAILGQGIAEVPGQAIRSRMLPLVTLGVGKAGLNDKVASHIHQVFLDYGPSVGHVRAACSDVRQVMSDMGTELGISNFGDCIGQVLGDQLEWSGQAVTWSVPEAFAENSASFLYPFALQTPGVLHIVDWIIRSTIEQFPWWAEWQSECKRLLQFCHGEGHRDRLRTLLKERAPPGQAEELSAKLVLVTGRFAAWRWKTLSKAVRDLERIEAPMRFLAAELGSFAGHVACRDTAGIGRIYTTCASSLFWDRARAIQAVIAPLMSFMGWLQGCDCHEEQLRQRRAVSCNFKGCRARGLSARLGQLRSQLQDLRQSLRPNSFGGVEAHTVSSAISHCLGSVRLKFMWVDELPYLVWQACLLCFFFKNFPLLSAFTLLFETRASD